MKRAIILSIFMAIIIFSLSLCRNDNSNKNLLIKTMAKDSDFIAKNIENINPSLVELDTIDDILKETETSPAFIKARVESLIYTWLQTKLAASNFNKFPKYITFRFFKLEREFEIWGAESINDSLRLLCTLPVCSADFEPAPKLNEGDGKTPEGFYECTVYYGSKYSFMWIKLNTNEVDNFGQVNDGSSFKICINYPREIDRARTKEFIDINTSPGGEICVHGNCVSAGCISFRNRNFLPVYCFAVNHNQVKYGKVLIQIFPFRFTDDLIENYSNSYQKMEKEKLVDFWENLQQGYNLFNSTKHAIKVSTKNNMYFFETAAK